MSEGCEMRRGVTAVIPPTDAVAAVSPLAIPAP
jgi:hypothetical protein